MKKMGLIKYCSLTTGILFLLLRSCVEPFSPVLDEADTRELLVVEAVISDESGPFVVRLSSSVPVYNRDPNVINEFEPVSGAEVQIQDDQGNYYLLFENEDGSYETDQKDLKGTPGFSYTLSIRAPDGKEYESSTVLMQEGPDIDEVYFEEYRLTYFDQETPYQENRVNILLDTKAPGDAPAYFKWEFEETWEFEMPTYIQVDHGTGQNAPPPTIQTVEVEDIKKHCWVSASSTSIIVNSTANTLANAIEGMVIQSLGPPNDKLNMKYSILIKQYAISRELYDYFRIVHESNAETGGIYEKTPVKINGNIYCCDGSREALGYFMASSVRSRRIFIEASAHSVDKGSAFRGCGWTTDIPRYLPVFLYGTYNNGATNVWSTNKYCTDCRVRGTSEKPDFWE